MYPNLPHLQVRKQRPKDNPQLLAAEPFLGLEEIFSVNTSVLPLFFRDIKCYSKSL